MTHTKDLPAEWVAQVRKAAATHNLVQAGENVIAAWERGDLAAAVRELAAAIKQAKGGQP